MTKAVQPDLSITQAFVDAVRRLVSEAQDESGHDRETLLAEIERTIERLRNAG